MPDYIVRITAEDKASSSVKSILSSIQASTRSTSSAITSSFNSTFSSVIAGAGRMSAGLSSAFLAISNAAKVGLGGLKSVFDGLWNHLSNMFRNLERMVVASMASAAYGSFKAVETAANRARDIAPILKKSPTGAADIEALKKLGYTPGGDVAGGIAGYGKMLQLGFAPKQAMDLIKGLTKATALSGAGPEEMNRAIIGLSQIQGKGKLSAEELRGQVLEAIPAASGAIKNAFGTMDVEELAKIPLDEFFTRFADGLNKLEEPAMTAASALHNIKQAGTELAVTFGTALIGAEGTDSANKLADAMKKMTGYAQEAGNWVHNFLRDILENAGPAFEKLKGEGVFETIGNTLKALFEAIKSIDIKSFASGLMQNFNNISTALINLVKSGSISGFINSLGNLFNKLISITTQIDFTSIINQFKEFMNVLESHPKTLEFLVKSGIITQLPGGNSLPGQAAYQTMMGGGSTTKAALAGGAAGILGGAGGTLLTGLLGTFLGGKGATAIIQNDLTSFMESLSRHPGLNPEGARQVRGILSNPAIIEEAAAGAGAAGAGAAGAGAAGAGAAGAGAPPGFLARMFPNAAGWIANAGNVAGRSALAGGAGAIMTTIIAGVSVAAIGVAVGNSIRKNLIEDTGVERWLGRRWSKTARKYANDEVPVNGELAADPKVAKLQAKMREKETEQDKLTKYAKDNADYAQKMNEWQQNSAKEITSKWNPIASPSAEGSTTWSPEGTMNRVFGKGNLLNTPKYSKFDYTRGVYGDAIEKSEYNRNMTSSYQQPIENNKQNKLEVSLSEATMQSLNNFAGIGKILEQKINEAFQIAANSINYA